MTIALAIFGTMLLTIFIIGIAFNLVSSDKEFQDFIFHYFLIVITICITLIVISACNAINNEFEEDKKIELTEVKTEIE